MNPGKVSGTQELTGSVSLQFNSPLTGAQSLETKQYKMFTKPILVPTAGIRTQSCMFYGISIQPLS